jgi:hypothetical protein
MFDVLCRRGTIVPELKIMSFWLLVSVPAVRSLQQTANAWWPFILYGLRNRKNTDSSKSASRLILFFDTFNTQ